MNLSKLGRVLLLVTQMPFGQRPSLGEIVVNGASDRPAARIRIMADSKWYSCNRSPASGTLCRAQLPLATRSVRVEISENGYVPFAKNFGRIDFNNNSALVDMGRVSLIKVPAATMEFTPFDKAVQFHLPNSASENSLKVIDIQKNADSTEKVQTFDVILANTGKAVILKQFEIDWAYESTGGTSNTPAYSLRPTAEYLIELPIKLWHQQDNRSQLLPSPLVVPAGTATEPNPVTLRLVLYYSLVDACCHPATHWNITYNLALADTDGVRIPIFVNEKWK
jgi:hypothetical protein